VAAAPHGNWGGGCLCIAGGQGGELCDGAKCDVLDYPCTKFLRGVGRVRIYSCTLYCKCFNTFEADTANLK